MLLEEQVVRDNSVEYGPTTRTQQGVAAQILGGDQGVRPVCHEVVQGGPPAERTVEELRVPARNNVRGIYESHYDRDIGGHGGGGRDALGVCRRGGGSDSRCLEGGALGEGVAEFELVVEDLRGRGW